MRIIREGFPDTSNKKRNQMDTTEPQQQRGILKGSVDSQQDSTKPLTTKKNILWDEEAIASHERGTRQKITEPKTLWDPSSEYGPEQHQAQLLLADARLGEIKNQWTMKQHSPVGFCNLNYLIGVARLFLKKESKASW